MKLSYDISRTYTVMSVNYFSIKLEKIKRRFLQGLSSTYPVLGVLFKKNL